MRCYIIYCIKWDVIWISILWLLLQTITWPSTLPNWPWPPLCFLCWYWKSTVSSMDSRKATLGLPRMHLLWYSRSNLCKGHASHENLLLSMIKWFIILYNLYSYIIPYINITLYITITLCISFILNKSNKLDIFLFAIPASIINEIATLSSMR